MPKRARIEVDDELYLATANTLLGRLRSIDDGIDCALLIGHNPGLQDLADRLAGAGDAGMRAQVSAKFPTAAVVTLSFDTAWADLRDRGARIDDLFMPRPRQSLSSSEAPIAPVRCGMFRFQSARVAYPFMAPFPAPIHMKTTRSPSPTRPARRSSSRRIRVLAADVLP